MEAYNDSSGYESILTLLDDDENGDDLLSNSGVSCITTGSCEELVTVRESTQLEPDSSLWDREQLEEEQQEASWEEGQPCVPDCEQAEGESAYGVEPEEALLTPQIPPEWLLGASSSRGVWCPSPLASAAAEGSQSL